MPSAADWNRVVARLAAMDASTRGFATKTFALGAGVGGVLIAVAAGAYLQLSVRPAFAEASAQNARAVADATSRLEAADARATFVREQLAAAERERDAANARCTASAPVTPPPKPSAPRPHGVATPRVNTVEAPCDPLDPICFTIARPP